MVFYPIPNLLRFSLGLSAPLLLFRPQAQASVDVPAAQSVSPVPPSLIAEFEPTTTEPVGSDTDINTTGGRYSYFQPPADGRPFQGARTTTGTRGGSCPVDAAMFSGLGPRSIMGLTTSARPEFVWYLPDALVGVPLLFRLLAMDVNGQPILVDSVELSAQAGFMRYQLPDSVPALEVGQDYLWQVIVMCDPERASSFLTSTLGLRLTTPTPELTTALATATTDAERAIAYGAAGIWYDALATVAAGTTATDIEVRTGLIQDLATFESDDEAFSSLLITIAEQTATE
ncbi:c2 domain protein [Leptolyngbya sp. Heron Island J]|uniref:DUF928 domain-containing protein n=1 Tax=Leptolyngbya sp. Heron Island J TaxID=1385935 RepID=UPI0003B96AC4|nr:DUF928 domain-containing protein [Leptolyngbya sp. Heron Island J]ESA34992.1 c2 domain protein [Leptolyngbya sp. Heron Island J]